MLFNFQEFVEDLRVNPEKKEIIEKYEKIYGDIVGTIKDQPWFKEYVWTFPVIEYIYPEELKKDFDWAMLKQLVLASFSSDYELKKEEWKKERELYIAVKSGDQSVVKKVSELWSFQIQRLYEIYVEEQINLHVLKWESEDEKIAIEQERQMRLKKWQAVLDTLDIEEKSTEAKKEQEDQLSDLMWKL